MGRPPMPAKDRKVAIVNVRFRETDEVFDALCRRALAERRSVPLVARDLLAVGLSVTNPERFVPVGRIM